MRYALWGFETGGIPEMIDHLKNGYVAKYKDTNDLAVGIKWIIDNQETFRFSEACVRKVHDCYRESVIAEKYIALYQSLCNKRNSVKEDQHIEVRMNACW